MSDNQKRIEASKRFIRRQHEAMDEADARAARPELQLEAEPTEADQKRQALVRDLSMRGGLTDRRLRDLVHEKLGSAAWSDQALELLDKLMGVLAR